MFWEYFNRKRAGEAGPRADDLFLGLWFTGALAFCVLVYLTGAARYLLPAVPPFILMVVRRAELRTGGRLLHLAVPALFATAIMAMAVNLIPET